MSEGKKPKGWQKGKPLTEKHKMDIAATKIMQRVQKAAEGQLDMTAIQLKASELFLSKTLPSLSNVEQTNINADDAKSLEQIQAELVALVKQNPELLSVIMQANPNKETSQESIYLNS